MSEGERLWLRLPVELRNESRTAAASLGADERAFMRAALTFAVLHLEDPDLVELVAAEVAHTRARQSAGGRAGARARWGGRGTEDA